jgi:hypothetical protein
VQQLNNVVRIRFLRLIRRWRLSMLSLASVLGPRDLPLSARSKSIGFHAWPWRETFIQTSSICNLKGDLDQSCSIRKIINQTAVEGYATKAPSNSFPSPSLMIGKLRKLKRHRAAPKIGKRKKRLCEIESPSLQQSQRERVKQADPPARHRSRTLFPSKDCFQ